MKKLLLLIFLPIWAFSQNSISGTVISETDGQPIVGVSVFINNSTIGTVTDVNGNFMLRNLSTGKHEIVVSIVGYHKLSAVVEVPSSPLKIQLKEKVTELKEVEIIAFDKNGWQNWGKLFMDTFIGTTFNAEKTQLKNRKDLRFKFYKSEQILVVSAVKPLIIENKSLGYDLEYHLETFEINFPKKTSLYAGYPFFKEHKKPSKKQLENRRLTYDASLIKFMRSLYHGKTAEEGYLIRKLEVKKNLEKVRVRQIRDLHVKSKIKYDGKVVITSEDLFPRDIYNEDSVSYFKTVLSQPDQYNILHKDTLWAQSLLSKNVDETYTLHFDDYLYVVNTKHKEATQYVAFNGSARPPGPQTSLLTLVDGSGIEIQPNGNYFPPLNLYSGDYWSWSNKVADLLPLDYSPITKND